MSESMLNLDTVLQFSVNSRKLKDDYLKIAVEVIRLREEKKLLMGQVLYYQKNRPLSFADDSDAGDFANMQSIDPVGYSLWAKVKTILEGEAETNPGRTAAFDVFYGLRQAKNVLGNLSVSLNLERIQRQFPQIMMVVTQLEQHILSLDGTSLESIWDKYSGRALTRVNDRFAMIEKELTKTSSRRLTAFNALLRSSPVADQLKAQLDDEAKQLAAINPLKVPESPPTPQVPRMLVRYENGLNKFVSREISVDEFEELFIDESIVFSARIGAVAMSFAMRTPLNDIIQSMDELSGTWKGGSFNRYQAIDVTSLEQNTNVTAVPVKLLLEMIERDPTSIETVGFRIQKQHSKPGQSKRRAHEAFISLYAAFHDLGPEVYAVWDHNGRPVYLLEAGADLTSFCNAFPGVDLSLPFESAMRRAATVGLLMSDIKPGNMIFLNNRAQFQGQIRFIDLEGASIIPVDFASEECVLFVNTSLFLITIELSSSYNNNRCIYNTMSNNLKQFVRSQIVKLKNNGNSDLCGVLTRMVYDLPDFHDTVLNQTMIGNMEAVATELIRTAAHYSGFSKGSFTIRQAVDANKPIFPQLLELALQKRVVQAKRPVPM